MSLSFYKFCGSISTGTIIICQVGNLNGLRAKFVGFCYMSTWWIGVLSSWQGTVYVILFNSVSFSLPIDLNGAMRPSWLGHAMRPCCWNTLYLFGTLASEWQLWIKNLLWNEESSIEVSLVSASYENESQFPSTSPCTSRGIANLEALIVSLLANAAYTSFCYWSTNVKFWIHKHKSHTSHTLGNAENAERMTRFFHPQNKGMECKFPTPNQEN